MAFSVPIEHRRALQEVLFSGKVPEISAELSEHENFDDPDQISGLLAEKVGLSSDLAERFVNVLVSMILTRDSVGEEIEPFLDEVLGQLDLPSPVDENSRDALIAILQLQNLARSPKAERLALQHDRTFVSAQVISSLRALFADDDLPSSYVVAHELQVSYIAAGKRGVMTFGVDSEDLAMLAKLTSRALRREAALDRFREGFDGEKDG